MRRRPTLPHTFAYSTIGPAGLNFRVRDGNGWYPRGKITANLALGARSLDFARDFGWRLKRRQSASILSMRGASQVLHRVARKGPFTRKGQA